MAIKYIVIVLFIGFSQEAFAQTQLGKYLDSLMKHAPLDPTPKPQKIDTAKIKPEKYPSYQRDTSKWDRYQGILREHYNSEAREDGWYPHIGDPNEIELTLFKRAPPRKNRLFINFPLRIDRTVLSRLEWNPIYERDLTGWLSIQLGATFYGRKIDAHFLGDPGKPAWFGGGNGLYWLDGWGQNVGIKLFCHVGGNAFQRLGINVTYQQRNIRVFGPRVETEEEMDRQIDFKNYIPHVVDKKIEEGRLRVLIFREEQFSNALVANIFGGAGFPLWGRFDDKIRNISGDRKFEWASGRTNNIIMMRNYDIYLGASIGVYFGNFISKKK